MSFVCEHAPIVAASVLFVFLIGNILPPPPWMWWWRIRERDGLFHVQAIGVFMPWWHGILHNEYEYVVFDDLEKARSWLKKYLTPAVEKTHAV